MREAQEALMASDGVPNPLSVTLQRLTKVVLINQEVIPPYRIGVYNYLSEYLKRHGFDLTVVSAGIPNGAEQQVTFKHEAISLGVVTLARLLVKMRPDVVIYWIRLRHAYLFPVLLLTKLLRKKAIYWGHGSDLAKGRGRNVRYFANWIEYRISDALILYAEHLRQNVGKRFHDKVFVANNTLHFDSTRATLRKETCLLKYGITTSKNIICSGRMQRRKRVHQLIKAFERLNRRDVGLILVGPDTDGILQELKAPNIFKLGPIYGDERLDLLSAADVFCLPGAVGLSIVDAFYCGLPMVTEAGDDSPEIMYLKDGVNGFIVPRGDDRQLAKVLELLLDDESLRERFSKAARREIVTNGHIDRMCQGFAEALRFVSGSGQREQN
jgi:glycosyltransferase involved in cell wall biosynthesis